MTNDITTDIPACVRRRPRRVALAALCIVLLASCSTTRKTADAGDGEGMPVTSADAKGIPAKGGKTASGTYVDPMISTGSRQAQTAGRPPAGGQAGPAGLPEETMPGQQSPSISGLATQPTGVRAGSFSIFSSPTAPAPPPTRLSDGTATAGGEAGGSAPANGHLNAATKSVFSAEPAQAPSNCGTNADGVPLIC